MSRIISVCADQLRQLVRSRIAVTGLALVGLLTFASALTSSAHQADQAALRARIQASADAEFKAQPDRHPHRMVHYGNFAVRQAIGLAALDPGVEAFTGNLIFLEGHRQNTANFGDARQTSLLVRFGQLSPAFVLQIVIPLLLIFIGAGMVAGERERGTLRQALLNGVSGGEMLAGKALALGLAALLIAAPALGLLVRLAVAGSASGPAILLSGLGYAAYLAFWVVLVVAVSALTRLSRTALIALVGLWAFGVVLVPRMAPEMAALVRPLPTRIETDIAIQKDLRAMGDSHNPDDPHFAAFKQRTLDSYRVRRVEDLPVNYRGLLAVEGELLTSTLFKRYGDQAFAAMESQSRVMDAFALVSPTVALRRLSMAAAQTDLASYRRFVEQAEAYRFALVQRLNRLEADAVEAADDAAKDKDASAERRSRISASHWRDTPAFQASPFPSRAVVARALPALFALALWLGLVAVLAAWGAARLVRSA